MWGWCCGPEVVSSLELVVGAEQRGLLVVVGGVADGGHALRRRARRQRPAVCLARACARAHHYARQILLTFEQVIRLLRTALTDFKAFNIRVSINV